MASSFIEDILEEEVDEGALNLTSLEYEHVTLQWLQHSFTLDVKIAYNAMI